VANSRNLKTFQVVISVTMLASGMSQVAVAKSLEGGLLALAFVLLSMFLLFLAVRSIVPKE
jgi:hypothetical protein